MYTHPFGAMLARQPPAFRPSAVATADGVRR